MRVGVIGVGPVGLVTAACLARWGHDVTAADVDASRIGELRSGSVPFHEPRLSELVEEGVDAGRLHLTTDVEEALAHVDVAFVCVGTPQGTSGAADLQFVEAVGRAAAHHNDGDLLLVEKSTVPAATGDRLEKVIALEQEAVGRPSRVEVASNPEFLREGQAVLDTLSPDRIVLGVPSEWAGDQLRGVYAAVIAETDCPVIETDRTTAELIKHASNAFLATRLSFINAVAQVCDRVGADVSQVAEGMGHDARIGHAFLRAGIGYGGSCFPKDVDAFAHLAASVGAPFPLLDEVRRINEGQRQYVLDLLADELWHLSGKRIALLGAAFKPDTDDLREAPAVWLAERLLAHGAEVRVSDPVALPGLKEQLPDVTVLDEPLAACQDAHAVVLCTEWPQHVAIEPEELATTLAWPIVIDGRNAWDPEEMRAAGLRYHGIGRGRR